PLLMDPISPIDDARGYFLWSSDTQDIRVDGVTLRLGIRLSVVNDRRNSHSSQEDDFPSSPSDPNPDRLSPPGSSEIGTESEYMSALADPEPESAEEAQTDPMSISLGIEPASRSASSGLNVQPDYMSISSRPYGLTSPTWSFSTNAQLDDAVMASEPSKQRSPSPQGSGMLRDLESAELGILREQIEEIDSRQTVIENTLEYMEDYQTRIGYALNDPNANQTRIATALANIQGRRAMFEEEWHALQAMKTRRQSRVADEDHRDEARLAHGDHQTGFDAEEVSPHGTREKEGSYQHGWGLEHDDNNRQYSDAFNAGDHAGPSSSEQVQAREKIANGNSDIGGGQKRKHEVDIEGPSENTVVGGQ
ncbi:MAG: hypothetical protein Q9180_007193, partial [Flavoplaca navasiana]